MVVRTGSDRPLTDRLRRRFRAHVVRPLRKRVLLPLRRRRHAQRTYRPVFVTGAMGSGTTLMAFTLGQRFECAAVVPESGHEVGDGSFLHVQRPGDFASVADYLASMEPDPAWSPQAAREALLALYRSRTDGPGDVVIDKGPNATLLRAPFLLRCFPEARFVLVFRDPVATVEGFRRKWSRFRDDPLDAAIGFYAALYERFLADLPRLGDRVIFVAYEAMIDRYDEVFDELGRWLELDPARRRKRLETRANVEGQGIRNVRRSRIGVDVESNRRARERLRPAEIARIEEGLGPLYRRLADLSSFTVPDAADPAAGRIAPTGG